jgi:hypothetical protein
MAGVGALMLLDSASMYFRAFFGVPETVTAPDGTPVNAVRGLLDMITRLVRARSPAGLIACMDADWRPAFRVAAVPSYKAHRANPDGTEQVPDALTAQIPVIEEVLAAAGVAMAAAGGYEADDVIGTLSARAAGPVEVVTGDRDLFQLVDDSRRVRVVYIARGLAKLDVVDEAAVTARYQIPGRCYAAFATLRGDPATGCPVSRAWGRRRQPPWCACSARSRRCWQRWTRGTAGFRWAAGPSSRRRAGTWRRPCRSYAWLTTRRCRRWTGGCQRPSRTRSTSPPWTCAGTWGRRCAV